MNRIFHLLFLLIFLSCSSKEQPEQDDEWELECTEIIQHTDQENRKIQVIYRSTKSELLTFIDTSVVVQVFQDTLLLEEIHYNLEDGDSSKSSHYVNRYNDSGELIEKIDSVNDMLSRHILNFYEDNKLVRSENLTIMPKLKGLMEHNQTDTIKSVVSYYNEHGICTSILALSKNKHSSELSGIIKMDSTLTYNQYNEQNNLITTVTLTNGDTTSMSRTDYDSHGRHIKIIAASIEFGVNTYQFDYDKNGNVISELINSDNINELILTKYDNQNRPVKRQIYRSKSVADKNYE